MGTWNSAHVQIIFLCGLEDRRWLCWIHFRVAILVLICRHSCRELWLGSIRDTSDWLVLLNWELCVETRHCLWQAISWVAVLRLLVLVSLYRGTLIFSSYHAPISIAACASLDRGIKHFIDCALCLRCKYLRRRKTLMAKGIRWRRFTRTNLSRWRWSCCHKS
jgi:hypothetical protein